MLLENKVPLLFYIKKIKREIIYVIIFAIVVKFFALKYEDYIPTMQISIPAFIGTAISIILSFKLSQSYDRWWEARKVWGAIVNDSRSLVLLLQSFLGDEKKSSIHSIAYKQIAWCYCLGQSLRDQDPLENMNAYLDKKELKYISKHNNKPLAILQLITLAISDLKKENYLDTFNHVQLTNLLTRFSDSMGMAERIKNTVFPVTYRKLLNFMIYIFVITLSLALGEIDMIYEVPLLLVASSCFFLLEKTATHMQDPFSNRPSDTAITSIARTIEINLKQLIDDKNVPEPLKSDTFYLL